MTEKVGSCKMFTKTECRERVYGLNVLAHKIKEVMLAVLPITVIVLILNFTLTPLSPVMLARFLIGAVLIILGLAIFLFGVDIGITPIGNIMGTAIAKTNKLWFLAAAGLVLGFFISVAEPDLHILAGQVEFVTSGSVQKLLLVTVVSVGIAIMLTVGLMRIAYNVKLNKILAMTYSLIFILAIFTSSEFLAISFDSSGATTGAMAVPFMLALAKGISSLKKSSLSSEEDSFGLVGIASTGAIIAVMIMSIASDSGSLNPGIESDFYGYAGILGPFFQKISIVGREVLLALLPIVLIFFLFQKISFKLSRSVMRKIAFGLLFTFLGMSLFLIGVNAGFMDVGRNVGYLIASQSKTMVVIVGFIFGLVTILAEPAVYVLTYQIEDVTSGYVKRKIVMAALALGIGIAIALSMLRILVPELMLWHYLLPGYFAAMVLSFFVPALFVGIAFDSGGVASGPMTATFVLAFSQGVAEAVEGANVLVDGFGMIAMVAMTPLIALQILGLVYKFKSRKAGV